MVTTSGFGPDAYNFSKDKPVELIDGGGLLFLLREHAGVDARNCIVTAVGRIVPQFLLGGGGSRRATVQRLRSVAASGSTHAA